MRVNEHLFWIWLSEALGAANGDFRYLIELYETPYDIFCAEAAELERVEGLSARTVTALSVKSLERASVILDTCERLGIGIMPYASEIYPQILREIKTPPVLLYYVGTVPNFDRSLSLGLVGMRKMSAYGLETAYKISYELSSAGAIIVSGLAEGIDGVCAAAALRAGGKTVAVLGNGLDTVYPRHHGLLMKRVAEHGLLLSEYPPGTKPLQFHFPTRNRIISGLSRGVVVVEAGLGSGSLITAKDAVMQGRDVFAIPSNADGIGAEGTNGLLRDGAIFALEASDITARYQYLFADTLLEAGSSESKQKSKADLGYLREIGVLKVEKPVREDQRTKTQNEGEAASKASHASPRKLKPSAPCVQAEKKEKPREKNMPKEREQTKAEEKRTADAVLQSLSPLQRAILEAIPDDASVTVDELGGVSENYSEIIMALTMLEIMGLIRKLPGSLYAKV